MLRIVERIENVKFLTFHFPSWVLVTFVILEITLLSSNKAFAVNSTVPGERMLKLTWNAPESGADHYRLEITKTGAMSEPVTTSISHAYTKSKYFQIELEEGYSYTVMIQAVNPYGLRSNFSEKKTFSLDDIYNEERKSTQVTSNDETPASFSLFQNQPNPFNPLTTITYSLPEDVHVKLVVYNITGQKVTELQNDMVKSGIHSVVWDAAGMTSGTYFYTLKTNEFVKSNKMLLLK